MEEESDPEDLDVFRPTDQWQSLKPGDCFVFLSINAQVPHEVHTVVIHVFY